MSQAASQAAAFYKQAAEKEAVWTLRDEPAPMNQHGRRAHRFWSSRERVERIIKNVSAYKGFEPVQIPLETFLERWVTDPERDGLLVGLNWNGPKALGFDREPQGVRASIQAELDFSA